MADAKKKMTKAEKDKLKKEEAERREAEEEQERAKAIEEEKRKKKEEKLLAVEKQKLENEERKVRRLNMTSLMEQLENNKATLQGKDDIRRKEAKWARYMRCDGSPDPTIQGEINTYINLKMDNKERNDAESVAKDTVLDLSLISELEFLLADTPLEDLNEVDRLRYRQTIGELQHVIQTKLNIASLKVLCDATKLQDPETSNLRYCLQNDSTTLCVWGNLSKNPRIRSFEFTEAGFGFDIPRVLTLTSCCIRFLHTSFDHFSPYSKAFYPRRRKKEEVVTLEEEPEAAAQPAEEEKKEEEGEVLEKKEESGDISLDKEESMDIMAALRGEVPGEHEEQPPEEEEEVIEEDFEDPTTPEPPEWEDFDEEDDVVDLRAYNVVGGVFTFDILNLPPQPKNCKNWIITQLVDPPKLDFMEYIVDPPAPPLTAKDSSEVLGVKEEKKKEVKEEKRDEKPPINITLNLPKDVFFLEEPQIARWDAVKQFWRTDGFANFNYDEENRTFKCAVSHFGSMCLLQDAHINMPFQSWELRPHKTNACVLTIIAAIVELEIEVKDGLCCLSQPADKPELEKIRNQWVTPRELVDNMRAAGVNVFPAEDSSKFVTVQHKHLHKHQLTLDRLYNQMGLVASCMAFSWSKWNSEVDERTLILQGCEALQDEPLLEEDWQIFLVNKRRCMRLKMTEFDEEFSDEMAEDMLFKSNLYHYARYNLTDAGKERLEETSVEFIDCVQQLLKATQVLTYA